MRILSLIAGLVVAVPCLAAATPPPNPPPLPFSAETVDAEVIRQMERTSAKGLALAYIENGEVRYVKTYGVRNAKGDPLTPDTVMYGASLTKAVFAYTVLQLVDEGFFTLDTPIAELLEKPLPEYAGFGDDYAPYETLTDERWRKLTPRILLSHSGGFANFFWDNPGEKLVIHFDPGSRYAYSGDGLILLQFVLEKGRLKLNLGQEMQRRVFDPYRMTKTSMIWRPDFNENLADGFDKDGKVEPHDERSRVRAAGSLDTTIADFARFAANFINGGELKAASWQAMVSPQLPITTKSQFMTLQAELPPAQRKPGLAAGLGVVVFEGPQGRGFYKGGHNDTTGNTWVCVLAGRRCVVLLANDVRAEAAFPDLVRLLLGDTGVPYDWEYGFAPRAS